MYIRRVVFYFNVYYYTSPVYYANARDLPDRSLVDHASLTTHFIFIYLYVLPYWCMK